MSLEVTLICDGCSRVVDGGRTGKEVREATKKAGGRVNLPGGTDLCSWCVADGTAVDTNFQRECR